MLLPRTAFSGDAMANAMIEAASAMFVAGGVAALAGRPLPPFEREVVVVLGIP